MATPTSVAVTRNNLELFSEFPEPEAAVGPNWGVGAGVHLHPLPGVLRDEEIIIVRANYGIEGSFVNYRGKKKNKRTGATDSDTARVRSINYDPLPIPAFPDPRNPAWNVLPYGSWFHGRIASAKKSAVFGSQTVVAQYGAPMNFQSPDVASIAPSSIFSG